MLTTWRLIVHIGRLSWSTVRFGTSTGRLTLVLMVLIGIVLLGVALLAAAAAPFAIYPFA
jgi:hypothetical protein